MPQMATEPYILPEAPPWLKYRYRDIQVNMLKWEEKDDMYIASGQKFSSLLC